MFSSFLSLSLVMVLPQSIPCDLFRDAWLSLSRVVGINIDDKPVRVNLCR